MTRIVGVVVLLSAALGAQPPGEILLREGWQIQSSAKVGEKGDLVSTPAYRPAGWYKATFPATVLAALVDNRVYPDPYFGLNLKKIPGYRE